MLESPLEYAWVQILNSSILKARGKPLEDWALKLVEEIYHAAQSDNSEKAVREYLTDHYDRDPEDFAMVLSDMWNHNLEGEPVEWEEIEDKTPIWDNLPPEATWAIWDHEGEMAKLVQKRITDDLEYHIVSLIHSRLFQSDADQIREYEDRRDRFEEYQGTDKYSEDIKKVAEEYYEKAKKAGGYIMSGMEEVPTTIGHTVHRLRDDSQLDRWARQQVDKKKMPKMGYSSLDGSRVRKFFENFELYDGYEQWAKEADKLLRMKTLDRGSHMDEKRIIQYLGILQHAKSRELLDRYVESHMDGIYSGKITSKDSDSTKSWKKLYREVEDDIEEEMGNYQLSPIFEEKVQREIEHQARKIERKFARGQINEEDAQKLRNSIGREANRKVYGWRKEEVLRHGKYREHARILSYRTPEMVKALEDLGLFWGDQIKPSKEMAGIITPELEENEDLLRQQIKESLLTITDIVHSRTHVPGGAKDTATGKPITPEMLATRQLMTYWEKLPNKVKRGCLGFQLQNGNSYLGTIIKTGSEMNSSNFRFLESDAVNQLVQSIVDQSMAHYALESAGSRSAMSSKGVITDASYNEIYNYLTYKGGKQKESEVVTGEDIDSEGKEAKDIAGLEGQFWDKPTDLTKPARERHRSIVGVREGWKPENKLEGIQIRKAPPNANEVMKQHVSTWRKSGDFNIEDLWMLGVLQEIRKVIQNVQNDTIADMQEMDRGVLRGPDFHAWATGQTPSPGSEIAFYQYRYGAAERGIRNRYWGLWKLLHNRQSGLPEGSTHDTDRNEHYVFSDADIKNIIRKPVFQQMWLSGRGYLGRRREDIPYDILPSTQRGDLEKHDKCDMYGINPKTRKECPSDKCFGRSGGAALRGRLRPTHLLPSSNDPALKDWLEKRIRDFVGKTVSDDGKVVRTGRHNEMVEDPIVRGVYEPGLADQMRDADELECRRRGLVKPCPGFPELGRPCINGKTISPVTGNERHCEKCRHTNMETGKKQSNGLLPDIPALWPANAAIGKGGPDFDTMNKIEMGRTRIARSMRDVGSPRLEENESDNKSKRGIWEAVPGPWSTDPRKDSPFPYDVHCFAMLPHLHTDGAPLHLDSVMDLKEWAREEVLKRHGESSESPHLSDDDLSKSMRDLIRYRFTDLFSDISHGDDFIQHLIGTSFDGAPSETAATTESMEKLYDLLSRQPRQPVSDVTRMSISRLLECFHKPDVDGRNMLVDDGRHESVPCKDCNGLKRDSGITGYTLGKDETIGFSSLPCDGCCATGDDMVRKLRSRSPTIANMSPEEVRLAYHTGDWRHNGILGVEPERGFSYWNHPKALDGKLDTRFILPGEGDFEWPLGDPTPDNPENRPIDTPRLSTLYGTGLPSSQAMLAHTSSPPIYAHDDGLYQFNALLSRLRLLKTLSDNITLSDANPRELENIQNSMNALVHNLSDESIAQAVKKFCGKSLEELIPKNIEGDITATAHAIPEDLKHGDSLDDIPCMICKRLHALDMHPDGRVWTLGEHDDLQEDKDGNIQNFDAGRCQFAPHADDGWMGVIENQRNFYKLYLDPNTKPQIKDLINGIDNTRILLGEMEGEGRKNIMKKTTRSSIDDMSTGARLSTIRRVSPEVVLGEIMRNWGGKSWKDKMGSLGNSILHAREDEYQELEDHRTLTHLEHNILPDRLNDVKNAHIARIIALHILDPYQGLRKHNNPFLIPAGFPPDDLNPDAKKLVNWARKTLGKDKEEAGEYSHSLTSAERDELLDYLHIVTEFGKLQQMWSKYVHDPYSIRMDDDGTDLPEHIFNFDDPKKPFLDMSDGGHMDEVFGRLRGHATVKSGYIRNANISQADYAFLQRWEHHPSMEYMAHSMRSNAMYSAWVHHNEEALKQIALNTGKPEDYYWLEGKTLEEVRESGLLDDIWTHRTRGMSRLGVDGKKFPIGKDSFENDNGTVHEGLQAWLDFWGYLQSEIILRCIDTEESKRSLIQGTRRFTPDGHNKQGTAFRCGVCGGGCHHHNPQDALSKHGDRFPYLHHTQRDANGSPIDPVTIHSPWDEEGLLLTDVSNVGHHIHDLNDGRSINFILTKLAPPKPFSSYKTGPQAWRSAFENMLRHGFGDTLNIPQDAVWEEISEDGSPVLSPHAVHFIQNSKPQCIACEGNGGFFEDYLSSYPKNVQSALTAMKILLTHSYNTGMGIISSGEGTIYSPENALWVAKPYSIEELRDLAEYGIIPAKGHGSEITTQQFMDAETLRYLQQQEDLEKRRMDLEIRKAVMAQRILDETHPFDEEEETPLGEPKMTPVKFEEVLDLEESDCPDCDAPWKPLGKGEYVAHPYEKYSERCGTCGGTHKLYNEKYDANGKPKMKTLEIPSRPSSLVPQWSHTDEGIEENLEIYFRRAFDDIKHQVERLKNRRSGDVFGDISRKMEEGKRIEESNIDELATPKREAINKILTEGSEDDLRKHLTITQGWQDSTIESEISPIGTEKGRIEKLRQLIVDRVEGPKISEYDNQSIRDLREEMQKRGWEKIPISWSRQLLKDKLANYDDYSSLSGKQIRCEVPGCNGDDARPKIATHGPDEIFRDNGTATEQYRYCDEHKKKYDEKLFDIVKGREHKIVGGLKDLQDAKIGNREFRANVNPFYHNGQFMGLFPRKDQSGGGTHWIPIFRYPPSKEYPNGHFRSMIEIPGHTKEEIEASDDASVKSRDGPGWDSTNGVASGIGTVSADFSQSHSGGDFGDQWVSPRGAIRLCPSCDTVLPGMRNGIIPSCEKCGFQPSETAGGMEPIHYHARGIASPGGHNPLQINKPMGFKQHRGQLRARLQSVANGDGDPALIPCHRCNTADNKAGLGYIMEPRTNEKIPCPVCKPIGMNAENPEGMKGFTLHPDELPIMSHYNLNVRLIKKDVNGVSKVVSVQDIRALLEKKIKSVKLDEDGELVEVVPKEHKNRLAKFDELFRGGDIPFTLVVPHPGYGANLEAHLFEGMDSPFKNLGTPGQVGGFINKANRILKETNNEWAQYHEKIVDMINDLTAGERGWKGPKSGDLGSVNSKGQWLPSVEMENLVNIIKEQVNSHGDKDLDPVNQRLHDKRKEFLLLYRHIGQIMEGIRGTSTGGNEYQIEGLGDIDRGTWGAHGRMLESLIPQQQRASKFFVKNNELSVDAITNPQAAGDHLDHMELGAIDLPVPFHSSAWSKLTDDQKRKLRGDRTWGIASRSREDQMNQLLSDAQGKIQRNTVAYEPLKAAEEAMEHKNSGDPERMQQYLSAVKHFGELYSDHPIYQWPETWVGLPPPEGEEIPNLE